MPPFILIPPVNQQTHPRRRRWLGSRNYWVLQTIGWGLVCGSVTAFQLTQQSQPDNPMDGVPGTWIFTLLCVALSHLLRVQLLWWRRHCRRWRALACGIIASSLLTSLGLIGPAWWLTALLEPSTSIKPSSLTVAVYAATVVIYFLGFCIWTGLYFGILYLRRYREATIEQLRIEALVKDAELRALRSQVNPHFLFNSLNSLRALIPPDLTRPREAVTVLADLLRAGLTMGTQDTVPLATELETTRNFLALEQLRFQERLRVRWVVDARATEFHVPPLSVQGLMENSVKYGIEPFEEGGDIGCSIQLHEGLLTIEVTNHTVPTKAVGTRVGLDNLRQRLRLLFGEMASLDFSISPEAIATARIVLPAAIPVPATARP